MLNDWKVAYYCFEFNNHRSYMYLFVPQWAKHNDALDLSLNNHIPEVFQCAVQRMLCDDKLYSVVVACNEAGIDVVLAGSSIKVL